MTVQHAPNTASTDRIREPALRPLAQRHPGLDIVRNARIGLADRQIIVRSRDGSERRYAVGFGGIESAVFLDLEGPIIGGRMGPPLLGDWGMLYFKDAQGSCVLRITINAWLPESAMLPGRPVSGKALLTRSGVTELLESAGVPLQIVTRRDHPALDGVTSGGQLASPGHALPPWYSAVRGIAVTIWLITFLLGAMLRHHTPWLLVAAATTMFFTAGAACIVRLAARSRERHSRPTVKALIRPCPPPRSGATKRFLRNAAVRVQDCDVVIIDSMGRERWLPRGETHGVNRVVRVLDHDGNKPLAVELQSTDGQVRASLPWQWWFAGEEGEARLSQLTSALDLPMSDHTLGQRTEWPHDPVAQADAQFLAPLPPQRARQVTRFPDSILGGANSTMFIGASLASLLSTAVAIDSYPTAGIIGTVFASLASCGFIAPHLAHQVNSRLHLDRPARGQEPQG